MKKNSILSIASCVLLLLCASCDKDRHDVVAPDELGAPEHEYYVEATGEEISIPFVTNKEGAVSLVNQADESWVQLGERTFAAADGSLSVQVLANTGFPRRADIRLITDTREDIVSVFQSGAVEELFDISAGSMVVFNGDGETHSVATDINVPLENIRMEIRYASGDGWVKDCKLTNNTFTFTTEDNTDRNYTRRALIAFSYKNGWGESQERILSVIQARADNQLGTTFTFEELRAIASVSGYTLPEDALIEGYIVSTTEGGNAGDAIVEDYLLQKGTIDYTLSERTAYLESPDGRYGFRLIAESADKNDFTRYSRVWLKIGGAMVKRSSNQPYQYTIEGVSSDNLLSSMDGYLSMPWKEKAIDELTDDDINTLVKIKDCEIAMRKGPFTPVNEGYAHTCSYNRLAKYPILIRDIKGGSMYMFTNMKCTYRRNGQPLPYGSGSITGIVVHESYKSFERDGNIGRYQLRHLVREDIDLKKDFADNFSGLITEFRYAKLPGEFETTKLPNAILATKGNGELCHTHGEVGNYSPSYFYIGKSGSSYKNKYEEGAGIELDGGGIYQPWVDNGTESAQNTDGKGWFANGLKISWSNKYWWDSENDRGYCWLVNFSTEGISSDRVSLQFAMYNNSQKARSPRYWKAQYSLTTTDTSAEADSQWKDLGTFTVPDVAVWNTQNDWQTLGPRVYDFPLPTEILGHKSVSIRLMPRNNRAASLSEVSYDDSTISNGTGYNTLDYFAVRYNK